jgi:FtsZ-binding cell division protein ZapB
MEMDALDKLEERISKAVDLIEKLTQVKRRLEEENTHLKETISQLNEELKGQRDMATRLERQTAVMSERVKEKVEGLLSRISSYEQGLS